MANKNEWVTPYSTYLMSRYSLNKVQVCICENIECKKPFATNIDRKRCSPECAKKARKQNKRLNKPL